MRKYSKIPPLFFLTCLLFSSSLFSQADEPDPWKAGADLYSSFIWRGTKLGSGPAVQPVIEFTKGPFMIGAWGSFDFRDFQETDLYFSFTLPAGFSLGMTDYYSPDLKYFDYSDTSGSHAFEINLEFSAGNFNLSGNYVLNEAGSIGSLGNDLYFEAGYSFKSVRLFAGAGNGWHTFETGDRRNDFNVCNLGLEISKTIEITDRFNIPLTSRLIFNPDMERMFIVVGFSL